MKHTFLMIGFILLYFTGHTQSISVAAGFGVDVNNPEMPMKKFLPIEVQWYPFHRPTLSLFLGYDIGLNVKVPKEAFTLNPGLPGKTTLTEKLRTNLLTIGINIDIKLLKIDPEKQIFLSIMPFAISSHYTKVSFERYDKENYSILNQEVNNHVSGLVMVFGLKYTAGHKFLSIHAQTPPLTKENYGSKYGYASPVRIIFGYQWHYKK